MCVNTFSDIDMWRNSSGSKQHAVTQASDAIKCFSSIRLVFTFLVIQTLRTNIHHLTNYLSAETVLLFTPQTELNIRWKFIPGINVREHLAGVSTRIGRNSVDPG